MNQIAKISSVFLLHKKQTTITPYSIHIHRPNRHQTEQIIIHIVFKAHGIRISIPEILAPRLHSLSLLIAQNHLHNKLVPVLAQLLQLYFDRLCHFLAQWVQVVGWARLLGDEFLVQDGFYDLSAF